MAKSAKKPTPAHPQRPNAGARPLAGANKRRATMKPPIGAAARPGPGTGAAVGHGPADPNNAASGTKQARVLALLRSPAGTTITAMMQATGWQQHSVRGFLAGVVRKRLGLKLTSTQVDGTRIYRITRGGRNMTSVPRSKRRRAA
jgi:hypothetical protein